jgi:glycosyltransferase involved in cell wall biosynthesis
VAYERTQSHWNKPLECGNRQVHNSNLDFQASTALESGWIKGKNFAPTNSISDRVLTVTTEPLEVSGSVDHFVRQTVGGLEGKPLTPFRDEIFILTTGPIERLGGMERFLQYVATGFQERGYGVRVFHAENSGPERWRHPDPDNKLESLLAAGLHGYYIGRAAKEALHPGVRLVLSNSTVGWYPLGNAVRRAQFFHGTYRGQAEAIRPFIKYRGYLRMKWWDAMVLERFSGRNKIALCCSEPIRGEVRRYFGYDAHVVWYPIDLNHFRRLDMKSCREQLGLDESPVGLFVGSVSPAKGFSLVEQLARENTRMTMLVAVRGPVPESIRTLRNVRVFQNASYELLPILYNSADFSLSPSRYDAFSFVVAEALSCATPVIASPHGASLTFYTDPPLKDLLTASADDLEGFRLAVRRVLSDPPSWRAIIESQVRPRLEQMMAPENWWRRFIQVVGL